MTARNLALEALKGAASLIERSICAHDETKRGGAIWEICCSCGAKWADDEGGKPEYKEPEELIAVYTAIAALEAETGEPAAWIDPRDLAVLTCPGVKEFGPMRYAGVSGAQNSKATTPLYTAPPSAVPPGWKLVPIEPTPEMWKAGLAHLFMDVDAVWRAMLAEVPEAPK